MNKLISILLLFCLVVQAITSISVLTFYTVNKAFITEYFCINKDKPSLQCEGKCFVNKQLEKGQPSQEDPGSTQTEAHIYHLFMPVKINLQVNRTAFSIPLQKAHSHYQEPSYPQALFFIFHPPQA
jgi:hypothetical protein